MPLTTDQRDALRAKEGSNVLYSKDDKAVYFSSKRVDFRNMFDRTNIVELSRAMKEFKNDHPNERVNVVHV